MISANLSAQYTLDWMNPAGNFNKIGSVMAVDHGDNLLVAGFLQSENMYTRKYDLGGTLLWETIDSSGIQSMYEKPLWVNCDSSNAIYVVGKRYAISSGWEYPDAVIAVKYSPAGAFLWKRVIPITVLVGSSIPAFNLRSEVDVSGNLYIGTAGAPSVGLVLVKLNSNGGVVFSRNTTTSIPMGFASMRLKGNKVVLTGSGGNPGTAPLVAWDTSGALLYSGAVTGLGGNDVEVDDDGNAYLLTSFANQVSPTSGQDMVIYKFDTSGNQVWKKDFDLGGSDFATKFILSNNCLSAIGWGINSSTGSPYFDWKILQTDTAGTMLWNAGYNGTAYNDEHPYDIAAKAGGGVIVTGVGGPSPDPFNLSYIQMVIAEYDNTGTQLWIDTPNVYGGSGLACALAGDSSLFALSYYNMTAYHYNPVLLSVEDNLMEQNQAVLFPNPFSDRVNIQLSAGEFPATMFIYNSFAKLIRTQKISSRETSIDLSAFAKGIYFCKIVSENSNQIVKLIKH